MLLSHAISDENHQFRFNNFFLNLESNERVKLKYVFEDGVSGKYERG